MPVNEILLYIAFCGACIGGVVTGAFVRRSYHRRKQARLLRRHLESNRDHQFCGLCEGPCKQHHKTEWVFFGGKGQ